MLDSQAKKDLVEFFIYLGKADRETFWSTLECIGCAEEFKKYYHKNYQMRRKTPSFSSGDISRS